MSHQWLVTFGCSQLSRCILCRSAAVRIHNWFIFAPMWTSRMIWLDGVRRQDHFSALKKFKTANGVVNMGTLLWQLLFLKLLLSHWENECAPIVAISCYLCARPDQPKALSFEVFEVVTVGKLLSTSGKKKCFSLFSKSIISTLLAASALKMIVFSLLAHIQRGLISLHVTVLIKQEERVKRSPRHGRYCPRREQICAVGRSIT